MIKRYLFIIVVLILALIIVIPIFCLKSSSNERNWDFKGPIQKVTFGEDRVIDTLVVNGNIYRLANIKWADMNIGVEKGDTAIKKRGDKYIKFIKAHSRDTLYYNKEY